jgi:hypothetical protein
MEAIFGSVVGSLAGLLLNPLYWLMLVAAALCGLPRRAWLALLVLVAVSVWAQVSLILHVAEVYGWLVSPESLIYPGIATALGLFLVFLPVWYVRTISRRPTPMPGMDEG